MYRLNIDWLSEHSWNVKSSLIFDCVIYLFVSVPDQLPGTIYFLFFDKILSNFLVLKTSYSEAICNFIPLFDLMFVSHFVQQKN